MVANDEFLPAGEALARICNAECIILMAANSLRLEARATVDPWHVAEVLDGALRLLDGCYVALSEAQRQAEKEAAP